MRLVQDRLVRWVNLLLGEPACCRLRPDVSTEVDQLIVAILQSDIVLVVSQVLWLKWVDALIVA